MTALLEYILTALLEYIDLLKEGSCPPCISFLKDEMNCGAVLLLLATHCCQTK